MQGPSQSIEPPRPIKLEALIEGARLPIHQHLLVDFFFWKCRRAAFHCIREMKKRGSWPTLGYTKLCPLLDFLHSVYGIVFFKWFLIEKTNTGKELPFFCCFCTKTFILWLELEHFRRCFSVSSLMGRWVWVDLWQEKLGLYEGSGMLL